MTLMTHRPGMVEPDRVLSMGRIEQTMCKQITDVKLWLLSRNIGGAHGEMVIVVGNGHGDTSSNPGGDWLHFT